MKEPWTKDASEYHGPYFNFLAVRSFPKPLQHPHPPIFLGGSAKNVFQRIVEWDDGWMPAIAPNYGFENGLHTEAERLQQDRATSWQSKRAAIRVPSKSWHLDCRAGFASAKTYTYSQMPTSITQLCGSRARKSLTRSLNWTNSRGSCCKALRSSQSGNRAFDLTENRGN